MTIAILILSITGLVCSISAAIILIVANKRLEDIIFTEQRNNMFNSGGLSADLQVCKQDILHIIGLIEKLEENNND